MKCPICGEVLSKHVSTQSNDELQYRCKNDGWFSFDELDLFNTMLNMYGAEYDPYMQDYDELTMSKGMLLSTANHCKRIVLKDISKVSPRSSNYIFTGRIYK